MTCTINVETICPNTCSCKWIFFIIMIIYLPESSTLLIRQIKTSFVIPKNVFFEDSLRFYGSFSLSHHYINQNDEYDVADDIPHHLWREILFLLNSQVCRKGLQARQTTIFLPPMYKPICGGSFAVYQAALDHS